MTLATAIYFGISAAFKTGHAHDVFGMFKSRLNRSKG
jgi:hypothetical protein